MPKYTCRVTVSFDAEIEVDASDSDNAEDLAYQRFDVNKAVLENKPDVFIYEVNRHCKTCDDKGLIDYDIVGESTDLKPCPDC